MKTFYTIAISTAVAALWSFSATAQVPVPTNTKNFVRVEFEVEEVE